MSAVYMTVVCIAAGIAASAGALTLARQGRRHRMSLDDTWHEPQKLHREPTPRIGGIAIAAGLIAGAIALMFTGEELGAVWLLLAAVLPGFLWGLYEDLSKRGAVFARLAMTGMCAMIGYVLLDARITQVGVPGIDHLVALHVGSFAFTMFAVMGVGHAMNVIDGLNGLAGMTAVFVSAGLALVAWAVGDTFVFSMACVLAASAAGFLFVNYPSGRIFLGDGGAYLIGLLLAELAVLLVQRNSEVSAWFPLLLLAYPIWETLFSWYRRYRHGTSPGQADALHLHSLVYRRVVRWKGDHALEADRMTRNSLASLVLWILPVTCLIAAVTLWNRPAALQAAALAFALAYVLVYRWVVRFRVPAWLVLRHPSAALPPVEDEEIGWHGK
jgi:UDP-GlcNAc:undecaprenyl-phosphate/decaprenyl-phosphate GlcNAc-1-phosphate transferase